MDSGFRSLDDSALVSRYGIDFVFIVVLYYEKFSHHRQGCSVKIVLRTNLSNTWIATIFASLNEALETSGIIPLLL